MLEEEKLGGNGTQTAALAYGGAPPGTTAQTESWNGSSWTEVNDLNTARTSVVGSGIQTATLAYGGATPTVTAVTESWNGTSWTEVNDLNTARRDIASSIGTSNTSALAAGGYTTVNIAATEEYNGTSWVEVADLATARTNSGAAGTASAGLVFGGSNTTATEEWTGAGAPVIRTITTD